MPRLLRGVARTAVVAGTATAVSGRVQRRQAQKYAAQDQEIAANRGAGYAQGYESVAPQPVVVEAAPQVDLVQQLKDLSELRDQGILTEQEFGAQKAKLLNA
jgi:hypothetical protein